MDIKNRAGQDFEDVKMEFIIEWEDGKSPTLPDYVKRYPQFADELIRFALDFAAMENAAGRVTESPIASDATRQTIDKIKSQMRVPRGNLTEAHKAMGWSVGQFAQHLNLPKELTLQVVRGYEEWSSKLEQKIADLFALTRKQAAMLLSNTKPLPATQFKATGQPQLQVSKGKSFTKDLEEFDRQGKLTPEQRREWIEEAA